MYLLSLFHCCTSLIFGNIRLIPRKEVPTFTHNSKLVIMKNLTQFMLSPAFYCHLF